MKENKFLGPWKKASDLVLIKTSYHENSKIYLRNFKSFKYTCRGRIGQDSKCFAYFHMYITNVNASPCIFPGQGLKSTFLLTAWYIGSEF